MQVPNELWTSIFRHAIVQDKHALARLQRIDKRFYHLCQAKRLWYLTFRSQRPRWTRGVEYEHLSDLAWKERVLQHHERKRAWHDARDPNTDLDQELIDKLKERFGLPADCNKETVQSLVEMLGRSEPGPIHEMIYACNPRLRNLDMDTLRGVPSGEDAPEDLLTEVMYYYGRWLNIQRAAPDRCIISGDIPIPGTRQTRAVMWSYPDYRVLLDVELGSGELFCSASLQLQYLLTYTLQTDVYTDQDYKEFTIYDTSVQPPRRCHQLAVSDDPYFMQYCFISGPSPELIFHGIDISDGDKTVLIRLDLTTGRHITIYYHNPGSHIRDQYYPKYPVVTETDDTRICLWSPTNSRLLAQLLRHEADSYLDYSFTSALLADADIYNDGTLTATPIDSSSPPVMLLLTRILHGKTIIEVWDIQWPADYSERSWQEQLADDNRKVIPSMPFEESLRLLQQQQLTNPASCLQVRLRYSFTPEQSHGIHLCLHDSLAVSQDFRGLDYRNPLSITDMDSGRVLAQMALNFVEPQYSEALSKEVVLLIGDRVYSIPLPFKARQQRALQLAREYAQMEVDECRAYLQQRRESSDATVCEHQQRIDDLIQHVKHKRQKTEEYIYALLS